MKHNESVMSDLDFIDLLHPRIRSMALDDYNRGSWLGAIRCACVEVECAIWELAGELDTGDFTALRTLVNAMFGTAGGKANKLRVIGMIPSGSERDVNEARKDMGSLINGVIGYYRNPPMHHNSRINATRSARIMIICSEILYEIDACEIGFHRVGTDGVVKMVQVDSQEKLAGAIEQCDFDDYLNDFVIFEDILAESGLNLRQVSVLERCGLVKCETTTCRDNDGEIVDEIFRYQITPLGRRVVDSIHGDYLNDDSGTDIED